MLELKNISFCTSEKNILNDLNYTFERGKTYSVLGNNGVGKSTLAKIIMGLNGYYKNHKGEIILNNEDITDLKIDERARKGITMAWQEPARFKGMSVIDYLKLGNKNQLTMNDMIKYLNLVGLNEKYLNRNVDKTLSGGERKRIELASIVILKPEIVILDEPDSGIDMMSNSMIDSILKELKNNNSTVITITHREEISLLSDKAILLCNGMIRNEGTPEYIGNIYKKLCDFCTNINEPAEKIEVKKVAN
ncbi:ATP-binding cassette domain-containing protein [Oceanotoga sp. DSM 15011]|jgi:Fe-S cluster assembly ATP-binding protein|uniref:Iron-regulated ABC transporter ATPase subunit SufC n=1 Tax=Oceanotoga teriensis TaxID=515440 RepID=A0AA45C7X7_9BACT|nr:MULTISPECIES: ATP-binding cassette domain-containing protein [Oceanotoga]MDN5341291.1 Fe-S cluster assembly ATP-binding protein [Oceanotoga sp.]MDO7976982.1 ATP-binding cassette domain-containing protein [Oceanotoga teriensis]PWJ95716.1 iron-regulated ABC transporter ATPase subunit SufC [Oceanotoga teriensis]UYO99550.1 ATP-binding cassette domain-containing protein [Oceanotoga sp. DSM 15011]